MTVAGDLKARVINCLNKLSDRDTLLMATNELESIAKTLPSDGFAPFLNCLSATDSSEKSPVRRQCVRLIGVLSATHGDALSPHLSKMLSGVLRRLRDGDTAVRSACVDAVSSITTHVTKPPFSSILKPLVDTLFQEQDQNSQIGASLCLAAAVEAAEEPDTAELKKLLQRVVKLVKSDCFKAKPALLSLIGSIISTVGAKSKSLLNCLVPTTIEFLSSEDWAARKAAAEVLERLVTVERDLPAEFKASCIAALESRRFDKVKVVREIMNRTLVMWKCVSGEPEEESSAKDSSSGWSSPALSRSSSNISETPQVKRMIPNRSPPSVISSMLSSQKSFPQRHERRRLSATRSFKVEMGKVDSSVPQTTSSNMSSDDDHGTKRYGGVDSAGDETCRKSEPEVKRALFSKASNEKVQKFGGLKSKSRVVPFNENDNFEMNLDDTIPREEIFESQKDFEDFSLIHKQLAQIENQQSSLLDLLQRFIGSSQKGMSSLENRVNGLEKVIDEMSRDLEFPNRRISNTENTCCMIPGAEFLSPRFWRRAEGQNSTPKPFSSCKIPSSQPTLNKDVTAGASNRD